MLFVPVSKGIVISDLKLCPNVSPPVPEQCLLAFSASSRYSHRFNSESQAILVCSTSKQRRWQLLSQKHRETVRRILSLSAGATALVSFLLCSRNCLPKILSISTSKAMRC